MSDLRTNNAAEAVIFDLDGLLLESEQVWSAAKRRLTRERGGRWIPAAEHAMLGMSSPEWAHYMREELGVPLPADKLAREVVRIMMELYAEELPLVARLHAVERLQHARLEYEGRLRAALVPLLRRCRWVAERRFHHPHLP